MSRMGFEETLAFGRVGESAIARWLNRKGWNVLPVYELELDEGKGPQLFTPTGQLIAPDLFAFQPFNHEAFWIEAKHKSVFSWHRNTGQWTTGINLRHYEHYLEVARYSPWPVWLLFLHRYNRDPARPDDPWPCPVGLFGNTLDKLRDTESHRHKWQGGMVYWAVSSLRKLACLSEVI